MEGIYERILEEIPYEPEEGAKDTKSLDYSTRRWVTGMLNQLAEYVANEYNRILEEEDDKEWFWGEEEKK
jgi:succinate dehydrogenase flavin-adding protein (antitoxin of CptAB toxin-antitoxin module)